MKGTCPECGAQAHVTAFFVEEDGKRLAVTLAGMQPDLGRAVIGYLGLFKPAKTALRMARAAAIAGEVDALASAGNVCRDERGGVRRPCTPATWAAGIEQMLAQRASLTLPLANHNYLRAVVFGLADHADAAAERQREADAKAGRHLATSLPARTEPSETPLERELAYIHRMQAYGAYATEADADEAIARAHERFGAQA